MNPSTNSQPAPPPPSSAASATAACPRHPQEHFAPFCPLCLCERLSSSSSRNPPSTAASALKSIFRPGPAHLRRTQSFSASNNESLSAILEPHRKSCDVRLRNTLFSHDARVLVSASEIGKNLEDRPSCSRSEPEIRVSEIPNSVDVIVESRVQEIVELEREEEFKPMKDHIDLDSKTKKLSGSFWSAASVFSKKLQKWRDKQKGKKQRNAGGSTALPVDKPIGRHFRETQSEIADYGFGRRSCDIDPRFSLDIASRMSFDNPRDWLDESRASWDGYLIGRTFPKMPTMLAVVEDAPINAFRSDGQIPVEDCRNSTHEEENIPGGSLQTRDYYFNTSSRRRKSLDRSNSGRKTAAPVVVEIDEMKFVTPATTDISQGPKLVIPDRDLNSNSLRDDCSGSFELGFNNTASAIGMRNRKEESKKPSRWGKGWSIWGLINRQGGNKDGEEDKETRPNGMEQPISGSWPELEGDENMNVKGGFNPKMLRSNSSVSWKSLNMMGGSLSSSRKSNADSNGNGKKKNKEQEQRAMERNWSARHSPTKVDNGLLRFYFTPMRGSWRGGSGKVKPNQALSIARRVLRLY